MALAGTMPMQNEVMPTDWDKKNREEQQVWQCRNCGYTYIGKSAPLKCPVCAHPQSYFELKKINY